jgi:hypothetical protein
VRQLNVTNRPTGPRPRPWAGRDRREAPTPERNNRPDLNKRIAAHVSWSRTPDRAARTRPARDSFLARFERQVDPDNTLPPEQRRQRAEHARRAYMLQLAKRSVQARKQARQQRSDN